MSKVIIAGSRTIKDLDLVTQAVEESGFTITEVVSGTAWGADKLGEKWAEANGVPVKLFPAKWTDLTVPNAVIRYGKNGPYNAVAGHNRNEEMAVYAEAAIIIWDGVSTGSKDMEDRAKKHGLELHFKTVDIEKHTKEKQVQSKTQAIAWAKAMLEDENAIVTDTESCGGSTKDEVIGLGIVRLRDGKVLLNTLLKPSDDVKFNWYASQVHGISQKSLIKAPKITDIWSEYYELTHEKNVIAYNHSSDKRMLNQTLRKYALDIPDIKWHCAMNAYKKFTMRSQSISLTNACAEVNVKAGTHDAVEDALAAARIVHRIAQEYQVSL